MALLGMRMSKNIHFWEFSQDVWTLNIILRGTLSHLNKSSLCSQLEASLEPSLQTECIHEGLSTVASLKEWIEHTSKRWMNSYKWKGRGTEEYLQRNQTYMLPNDPHLVTYAVRLQTINNIVNSLTSRASKE